MSSRLFPKTLLALLVSCLVSAGMLNFPARAQNSSDVDLVLVLAVDCSFSVDTTEFRLQTGGLGKALRHQEIHDAIEMGRLGRIAVAVFQWSDDGFQLVVMPWTVVDGPAAAIALAHRVETMPRKLMGGSTSISGAMSFAADMLQGSPYRSDRHVMDISSDGRNNSEISPNFVRNDVVRRGFTINGLAIINEWPTLNKYFEEQVAGGYGSFVMIANDYTTYAEAIYRKLLLEIMGPGIS